MGNHEFNGFNDDGQNTTDTKIKNIPKSFSSTMEEEYAALSGEGVSAEELFGTGMMSADEILDMDPLAVEKAIYQMTVIDDTGKDINEIMTPFGVGLTEEDLNTIIAEYPGAASGMQYRYIDKHFDDADLLLKEAGGEMDIMLESAAESAAITGALDDETALIETIGDRIADYMETGHGAMTGDYDEPTVLSNLIDSFKGAASEMAGFLTQGSEREHLESIGTRRAGSTGTYDALTGDIDVEPTGKIDDPRIGIHSGVMTSKDIRSDDEQRDIDEMNALLAQDAGDYGEISSQVQGTLVDGIGAPSWSADQGFRTPVSPEMEAEIEEAYANEQIRRSEEIFKGQLAPAGTLGSKLATEPLSYEQFREQYIIDQQDPVKTMIRQAETQREQEAAQYSQTTLASEGVEGYGEVATGIPIFDPETGELVYPGQSAATLEARQQELPDPRDEEVDDILGDGAVKDITDTRTYRGKQSDWILGDDGLPIFIGADKKEVVEDEFTKITAKTDRTERDLSLINTYIATGFTAAQAESIVESGFTLDVPDHLFIRDLLKNNPQMTMVQAIAQYNNQPKNVVQDTVKAKALSEQETATKVLGEKQKASAAKDESGINLAGQQLLAQHGIVYNSTTGTYIDKDGNPVKTIVQKLDGSVEVTNANGVVVAHDTDGTAKIIDFADAKASVGDGKDIEFREDLNAIFYNKVYARPGAGRADVQRHLPTLLGDTKSLFFLYEGMNAWQPLERIKEGATSDIREEARNVLEDNYSRFLDKYLRNPAAYRGGPNFRKQLTYVNSMLKKLQNNPNITTWTNLVDQANAPWVQGLFGDEDDPFDQVNRWNLIKLSATRGGMGAYSQQLQGGLNDLMRYHTQTGKSQRDIFDIMTQITTQPTGMDPLQPPVDVRTVGQTTRKPIPLSGGQMAGDPTGQAEALRRLELGRTSEVNAFKNFTKEEELRRQEAERGYFAENQQNVQGGGYGL